MAGAGTLRHRGAGLPRFHREQGDAVVVVPDSDKRRHVQSISQLRQFRQGGSLKVAGNAAGQNRKARPRLDPAGVITYQE